MSPLFSDQKKASARYFHYPTTPLLRYTRSPLPLPVFLWRSAWDGCWLQEKHAKKEQATGVPLRRRAAANDRGYNARIGIRLGVRAIGNGQSVIGNRQSPIRRTCPPSRDRQCYCSRGLPRNRADLRQRIESREQTWLLSMHKASG